MSDRYESNPLRRRGRPDIVEHIKDLSERLGTSEVGLRIGHTSIEDGDLIVLNGDIRVAESDGTTVLRILHGSTPEIRMYPLGDTDTHEIAIFGFDFGTPPDTDQAMMFQVERIADFFQDGGKLFFTRKYAIMSHLAFGGEETYVWCSADAVLPEILLFRGKLRDSWQYDTRQTFYPGTLTASAGFSTWTHTYFSAFADQMLPIVTVVQSGSVNTWGLDGFSTSAFTVRFGSTSGSKVVNFWVVRCS